MCFFADCFDKQDVVVVDENVSTLTTMTKQNLTCLVVVLNAENLRKFYC